MFLVDWWYSALASLGGSEKSEWALCSPCNVGSRHLLSCPRRKVGCTLNDLLVSEGIRIGQWSSVFLSVLQKVGAMPPNASWLVEAILLTCTLPTLHFV